MASVKATSSARPGVTLSGTNVTSNGFSINFPATTGTADETWNITYTDDNTCTATTTYTVEAPCVYSISCNPTSKQLQDGSASTVVKVSSSKSTCTELRFTVNNGTTKYSGSGTGHTFTATSAGTYTFKSVGDTSKTAKFTVTEAPQECEYTCEDFLGATAYTIPANPTSRVKVFSYEIRNNKSKGDKLVGIGVCWYYRNSQIFKDASDSDWIIESGDTSTIRHADVYLPSSFIKENTGSSRTENLYIKPYHCADRVYSGNDTIPAACSCTTVPLSITQAAATPTCNITSITLEKSSYELPYGKCSGHEEEAGELAKNLVTIGYENCSTPPTWEALAGSQSVATGATGAYFKPPYSSTYTIRCREKTSLSKTYEVTCGNPPFTIKAKSGTSPGNGTITLSYTGTTISSWTDSSAANWQTLESPRYIRLDGMFVCSEITGMTLDLGLGSNYSVSNVSVEGQPIAQPPYSYGNTYLSIQTNGGCIVNRDRTRDPNCNNNDYYAAYTLTLESGATINVEVHIKPDRNASQD